MGSTISGADPVTWLPVKIKIASLHKGDNIQTPMNALLQNATQKSVFVILL